RMLSLEAFGARHRRDPAFQSWLEAARPLSGLTSMRDLLRLDMLEPRLPVVAAPSVSATSPATITPADRRPGLIASAWSGLKELAGGARLSVPNDNLPIGDTAEDDDEVLDLGALAAGPAGAAEGGTPNSVTDAIEEPELSSDRFVIGDPLDEERSSATLTKHILRRHVAVLGGSGSGKTTLALSVIEQLLLRGTPVVLIDRKGDLCSYANPDVWRTIEGEQPERRGLREQLASSIDVAVYTPGRTSGRPINITLLPHGIAELPSHEQQLLANVSAAAIGEMLHLKHSATHQRMSGILSVALRVLGSKSRSEVRLSDLIRLLEEDDEELVELTSRMDPTGRARRDLMAQLDSLHHRNAALFDGHGESLRMESLLGLNSFARTGRTRLSIIYTGFLGDNENVLFWISQFLSEALRFCQRNPNEKLQAVIMFDEADLYIPASSKPATKEPLESLLKRARSAGVGLMLATQSPGDLDYRSRDQITSWFIGRVREDTALKKLRAAFQSESGLDPSRVLPNQTVGQFHLIQEGKTRAIMSRRSLINADQVPFDRIEQLARETRRQETQQLRLDFG
ncbi:MAG: helicase HerA-like domain-containing protein, partial [Geminicoccaceae bacterium]